MQTNEFCVDLRGPAQKRGSTVSISIINWNSKTPEFTVMKTYLFLLSEQLIWVGRAYNWKKKKKKKETA